MWVYSDSLNYITIYVLDIKITLFQLLKLVTPIHKTTECYSEYLWEADFNVFQHGIIHPCTVLGFHWTLEGDCPGVTNSGKKRHMYLIVPQMQGKSCHFNL